MDKGKELDECWAVKGAMNGPVGWSTGHVEYGGGNQD